MSTSMVIANWLEGWVDVCTELVIGDLIISSVWLLTIDSWPTGQVPPRALGYRRVGSCSFRFQEGLDPLHEARSSPSFGKSLDLLVNASGFPPSFPGQYSAYYGNWATTPERRTCRQLSRCFAAKHSRPLRSMGTSIGWAASTRCAIPRSLP